MPENDIKHGSATEKRPGRWWGAFKLCEGHSMAWSFGPKRIVIGRCGNEWRIAEEAQTAVAEPEGNIAARVTRRRSLPDAGDGLRRFAFERTAPEFTVTPCTADRPVVVRLASPVTIPAGEEIVLFISSPLWLRVEVHQPGVQLDDMPIYRPSDSWFGINTREGRLCYSSRTYARMHLENLPARAQRAVTPVRLRNADTSTFVLEKLNIPVPCLSLFATETGALWTQEVSVVREGNGKTVALKIGEMPAQALTLVCGPREANATASLFTAIGEWLG